jgi:hypothetical protein
VRSPTHFFRILAFTVLANKPTKLAKMRHTIIQHYQGSYERHIRRTFQQNKLGHRWCFQHSIKHHFILCSLGKRTEFDILLAQFHKERQEITPNLP